MTDRGPALGRSATREFSVEDSDTAVRVGSGDVPVLATPRLLAWMEAVTCDALAGGLADHETSVGWQVQLTHARPSHVGSVIRVVAAVTAVDGSRVTLHAEANDADGRDVGQADIIRVIVERARFVPPA